MKKTIVILLIVFAISSIAGAVMKIQHTPGADAVLTISILSMVGFALSLILAVVKKV